MWYYATVLPYHHTEVLLSFHRRRGNHQQSMFASSSPAFLLVSLVLWLIKCLSQPPPYASVFHCRVEENGEAPANYLRVIFDFTARNQRELSISKGEVVQVN